MVGQFYLPPECKSSTLVRRKDGLGSGPPELDEITGSPDISTVATDSARSNGISTMPKQYELLKVQPSER